MKQNKKERNMIANNTSNEVTVLSHSQLDKIDNPIINQFLKIDNSKLAIPVKDYVTLGTKIAHKYNTSKDIDLYKLGQKVTKLFEENPNSSMIELYEKIKKIIHRMEYGHVVVKQNFAPKYFSDATRQLANTVTKELGIIFIWQDNTRLVFEFDRPENNDFSEIIDDLCTEFLGLTELVEGMGKYVKKSKILSNRKLASITFVKQSQVCKTTKELTDVSSGFLRDVDCIHNSMRAAFKPFTNQLSRKSTVMSVSAVTE